MTDEYDDVKIQGSDGTWISIKGIKGDKGDKGDPGDAGSGGGGGGGIPWYSSSGPLSPPDDPTKTAFAEHNGLIYKWQPPMDEYETGEWGYTGNISATSLLVASFQGRTPDEQFGPPEQYPNQTKALDIDTATFYVAQLGDPTWQTVGVLGGGTGS